MPPIMPPKSPAVSDGDIVVPYLGDGDGDADIITAEMGILGSRLREETIAAVEP